MLIQSFIYKWNKKLRPDLNFPVHIKRKMFKIWKQQMFQDIEKTVDTETKNSKIFANFANVETIVLGNKNINEVKVKYDVNKRTIHTTN